MGEPLKKPFVYIASLRRTGSTVLAEALTSFPTSFIFREPELCHGRFNLGQGDASLFDGYGVDLNAFRRRFAGRTISRAIRSRLMGRLPSLVGTFKSEVIEKLSDVVSQFGVKEIRHKGWESYLQYFPCTRIILTGRDPRDIYISMHRRAQKGIPWGGGTFTPELVAEELLADFRYQREMADNYPCLKIKYEALCRDPGLFDKIREFAESPLEGIGEVGFFTGMHPLRRDEYDLHTNRVTDQAVNRWERESDSRLLGEAQETFDRMGEYSEFWGYEK